ncbi:MAG: (2Fe-2S)-binding protein [Anaerolineaceae bacterium]|nr:(2Fe-2S)-binding protein [Anaerolineaceae bacterium]
MVNLIIDGKSVEAPEGTSIFRAAKQAGIEIPHLCEFEHLTPHGGCRMCVVEIEGVNTLQTSCTYQVQEGMVVRTDTPKTREARKFVLSLLFSERYHFCMFCPKTDGDCELQAAAYAENMDHWSIRPSYDHYPLDSSHPWMVWDQSRCILCQRCVRACTELSGQHTIVPKNRGARLILTTDYGLPWGESSCVRCGTCMQVCPTGAIMDRRSLVMGKEARAEKTDTICVECGLGCEMTAVTRANHLVKVIGDWNGAVNHGVMCEKGRFEAVERSGAERVMEPLVRRNGVLEADDWDDAVQYLIDHFIALPSSMLISARLPLEALYMFRELFHALGSREVTSTESSGVRYQAVLDVIDDPRLAVISPEMFDLRGKANSMGARQLGLTDRMDGAGKAQFIVLGDDLPDEALIAKAAQASFLAVAAAYPSALTERADVVFPMTIWPEDSGHYLNLAGQMHEAHASLEPPETVRSPLALLQMIADMADIDVGIHWEDAVALLE